MPSVRLLRGLRLLLIVALVLWLFSPYWIRAAVPLWLPFLVALALEGQFVFSNYRSSRPFFAPDTRAPGQDDRERFGSGDLQEWAIVEEGETRVWVDLADEPEESEEPGSPGSPGSPGADEPEEPGADADHPPAPARPGRRRSLGRSLLEAAAVLAVVAGIALLLDRGTWDDVSAADRQAAETRFSVEAGRIAEKSVRVGCDTSGRIVGSVQHADGVAVVGGDQALLTPELCNALYRLTFKGEVTSFSQTGRAIAVLAHEAWHLRGTRHEGVAECYAFQSGVGVGVRLGLDENEARRMMRAQLVANQQHRGSTLEYLVPRGCINGGRYDLAPSVDRFP